MQVGVDFVFNLDSPREQPSLFPAALGGWIAARGPIGAVKFAGGSIRDLGLLPRPDVVAAFPGYPHVIGFSGEAGAADFRRGSPCVTFEVGGEPRAAPIDLPPPPPRPGFAERLRARAAAAAARRRLRGAPPPEVRWDAGLRLLLAQRRAERGEAFDRAAGDVVLRHFAETFDRAFILQIGANDGVSGDPLAPWFAVTRWQGLLVEPIPQLAEALGRRYAGRPEIRVERAAISSRDGEASIYRLAEDPAAPSWHRQLASFDRAVLLKHSGLIPDLESRIVREAVPTLTVATLLSRHGVEHADLLAIDTEGHDWEILRQFDLGRLRPRLILFEHQHLSPPDKAAALGFVRRAGYHCLEMPEGDILAWCGR